VPAGSRIQRDRTNSLMRAADEHECTRTEKPRRTCRLTELYLCEARDQIRTGAGSQPLAAPTLRSLIARAAASHGILDLRRCNCNALKARGIS
jgi:hypothetical protein